MNKAATSQKDILEVSRTIVLEKGIRSINMREIANRCGIALGSVYNYFPSKTDLLCATIQSVWEDIFQPLHSKTHFDTVIDCVFCIYETIKRGDLLYPGFFTIHSFTFASQDKDKGREMMETYFNSIKVRMVDAIDRDQNIRKHMFEQNLTKTTFVDYIFSLLISILLKKQEDCSSLLELIQLCIY